MTRYVIGPDVAIRLARDQAMIRGEHQLLAPALLRSQVLSLLYQAVRGGEFSLWSRYSIDRAVSSCVYQDSFREDACTVQPLVHRKRGKLPVELCSQRRQTP